MSKNGSTWLTAFVVKSFAQARPYIFIDDEELKKSITYLKECQFPEGAPYAGCFNEQLVQFPLLFMELICCITICLLLFILQFLECYVKMLSICHKVITLLITCYVYFVLSLSFVKIIVIIIISFVFAVWLSE